MWIVIAAHSIGGAIHEQTMMARKRGKTQLGRRSGQRYREPREETLKSRFTSSEQPLTGHYPLSWAKGVIKRRRLTVLECAKDSFSEYFLRNPAFRDCKKTHDSSDVLDKETK
ncbi:hypothetical protein NPIL_510511 [Nephila pilipes]|uniref:Uncharacterized protein n=1 Tax=Nephila pilipes TaxID=299642 RepID=A0A8X6UF85_NEPPI|nr:hypothetical protein NPIL_510511 [Nephila pilipes]